MKIFDTEFDIDFWDADVLERYEKATENYNKAYKEVTQRNDGPAEKVRNLCYIVFDFLDDLLGEGASQQIFGDTCNLRQTLRAMQLVNAEAEKQRGEVEEEFSDLFDDKPAPQNREQRRAAVNKAKQPPYLKPRGKRHDQSAD